MFFRRKETDPGQASLSLQKGIAALVSMQNTDGSFPLYQRTRLKPWHACHPLFATVTVLLAAADLLPLHVISKAVDFIFQCRAENGTWVFDPDLGIPADSDDTACALAVLARHGNNLVTDNDVELLRSFWRTDGGPFGTWKAEGIWSGRDRDDAVVNCNVLLALKELGANASTEEVNAVVHLVQKSIAGSRYYSSPITIAYAACRAGLSIDLIPGQIIIQPKPKQGILPMAQWLSMSRQWNDNAVTHLLTTQARNGHWSTEAWFTAVGNPTPVWGSPAITTALCLEGLHNALTAPPAD